METMRRLDPEYGRMSEELGKPGVTVAQKADLTRRLGERYTALDSMYHQVAVQFADL